MIDISEILQAFEIKLNKYIGAKLSSTEMKQLTEMLAREAVNEIVFSDETLRRCLYG